MRKKIALIFIFTLSLAHSQVPDGYYDSATGVNYELKSQLYEIINNHSDQGYNSLDDFYTNYDFDNYYENDNTILDIYSSHFIFIYYYMESLKEFMIT